MSIVIVVTAGKARFLAQTDESVEVPKDFSKSSLPGIPEGTEPIVDIKKLERRFAEVNDLIVGCCQEIAGIASKIPKPENLAVELGITFAGEAGVPMLTQTLAEAAIKVSIEWKPNS